VVVHPAVAKDANTAAVPIDILRMPLLLSPL